MTLAFHDWLAKLQAKRQRWVDASHENNFDRGIWNATVEKYADPSHFIFELLQNAEDQEATWVRFELGEGFISFEHDGLPFDRGDIDGITGIGNTTKLEDTHKIGCFGIGFKSVYVITDRPQIHSLIEGVPLGFAIEDLVVPKLIESTHRGSTTRIVLPLRADRAALALDRAREGLATSGPKALLFLEHVRSLDWMDGTELGRAFVTDEEGSIRTIRSKLPDGSERHDRFLVLSHKVETAADRKQYDVKAALRLNDGGELVPEEAPTRLSVFFETEELTGLRFTVHGPFQLTDNRANIKRDDPWNVELIETIGRLIADALPGFRDRGLLKRGVLELLPNGSDDLPDAFTPILATVVSKFSSEALIPVHGGGFADLRQAVRGPADLRDLFGTEGLATFAGLDDRRWIATGLRNSRADAFLAGLAIKEWGYAEFMAAFQTVFGSTFYWSTSEAERRKRGLAWFEGLTDEQAQYFYLALESALKTQKRSMSISNYEFVRLEDGRRKSPLVAKFAPAGGELDRDAEPGELFLVRNALIRSGRGRGKDVEQFLRRMGVRDLDERAYVSAILRAHYQAHCPGPNRERHLQHMRRFLRWWKEHGDVSLFSGIPFIRAGSDASYLDADDVYFGEPFMTSALAKVYDGSIEDRAREPLWDGYAKLPRKELMAFLGACGVESRLAVRRTTVGSHPLVRELFRGFGGTRHTNSGTNADYVIDDLAELLARGDRDISRLIWDAVRSEGAEVMFARYAPNQQHEENRVASRLALALSKAAWIPAKDGSLREARTMVTADLARGFTIGGNEGWLNAIGFGEDQRQRSEQHKARRKAGEMIGLTAELVDRLSSLPPEALAELNADIIRKIENRSYGTDEFPERDSANPARRAERLAERARNAPAKTYETRERSVRTSNGETKGLAKTYLEDNYTNRHDEMICQGCHEKMPFNLSDGTPYFEACQLIDTLAGEHAVNHLAMCPTCSAKWHYANPVTDSELQRKLTDAEAPDIEIELAGQPVRLRFTQVHLDDIRTVAGLRPADRP